MCGINGGWVEAGIERSAIERSLDAMIHRGPDDWGVFQEHPVFLGNRRLSIIDLDTGRQPIFNEDRSVAVVLNGEIYNYKELIPDLRSRGHVFATKTDTETLVHLYEEEGTDMMRRLRGMFAFAIWDSRRRRLFVARDRFGKKPLYYSQRDGRLIFASELKALRVLAGAVGERWSVREQGVYDYLSLGAIPQPETVFEGVHALPPASWMTYDGGSLEIKEYWRLECTPRNVESYMNVMPAVRELISDAVRIRLRSDVPLGVFLSGGIDSSVIAYEASRQVGASLKTFTIRVNDPKLDESHVARRTAESLGVENTVLTLEIDPLEDLESVIRLYDQPFADASALPSMRVSRLAAEHVKVVLNGDGGDELFAGYRRYLAFHYGRLLGWLPRSALAVAGRFLQERSGPGGRRSSTAFAARLMRGLASTPGERYLIWTLDMLGERDKARIGRMGPVRPTEAWIEENTPMHTPAGLDRAMLMDQRVNLLSCLLVKMDIASMSASVEARSPLLDHHTAEFAARLPESYKIRYGKTKALLRDAYDGLLPPEVIHGPKRGFEPPILAWLNNDLRELLLDTLGSTDARVTSYLDRSFVDELIAGKIMTDRNWAYIVYALLVLELWLREEESGRTAG